MTESSTPSHRAVGCVCGCVGVGGWVGGVKGCVYVCVCVFFVIIKFVNVMYVPTDGEFIAGSRNGYQGQVYLCPPENFYSENRSVSTGLVLLYLHDSWRTINLKSQTDTSDLLDSLCQQLGFSGVVTNSGTSRRASQYSFDYCYNSAATSPHP